ncbi:MAG: hypothetical protein EBX41_06735, partial [Chitinophagia bacterium]|nr:hypothetical protein [Chitinophagia bacterium]
HNTLKTTAIAPLVYLFMNCTMVSCTCKKLNINLSLKNAVAKLQHKHDNYIDLTKKKVRCA